MFEGIGFKFFCFIFSFYLCDDGIALYQNRLLDEKNEVGGWHIDYTDLKNISDQKYMVNVLGDLFCFPIVKKSIFEKESEFQDHYYYDFSGCIALPCDDHFLKRFALYQKKYAHLKARWRMEKMKNISEECVYDEKSSGVFVNVKERYEKEIRKECEVVEKEISFLLNDEYKGPLFSAMGLDEGNCLSMNDTVFIKMIKNSRGENEKQAFVTFALDRKIALILCCNFLNQAAFKARALINETAIELMHEKKKWKRVKLEYFLKSLRLIFANCTLHYSDSVSFLHSIDKSFFDNFRREKNWYIDFKKNITSMKRRGFIENIYFSFMSGDMKKQINDFYVLFDAVDCFFPVSFFEKKDVLVEKEESFLYKNPYINDYIEFLRNLIEDYCSLEYSTVSYFLFSPDCKAKTLEEVKKVFYGEAYQSFIDQKEFREKADISLEGKAFLETLKKWVHFFGYKNSIYD